MDKTFHPTFYWSCDNLSMLGLKLIHISKGIPGIAAVCWMDYLHFRELIIFGYYIISYYYIWLFCMGYHGI